MRQVIVNTLFVQRSERNEMATVYDTTLLLRTMLQYKLLK